MIKSTPAAKNSKPDSGLVYLLSDECPARHAESERISVARRAAGEQGEPTGSGRDRRVDLRKRAAVDRATLAGGDLVPDYS